jgi:hypothetical protein
VCHEPAAHLHATPPTPKHANLPPSPFATPPVQSRALPGFSDLPAACGCRHAGVAVVGRPGAQLAYVVVVVPTPLRPVLAPGASAVLLEEVAAAPTDEPRGRSGTSAGGMDTWTSTSPAVPVQYTHIRCRFKGRAKQLLHPSSGTNMLPCWCSPHGSCLITPDGITHRWVLTDGAQETLSPVDVGAGQDQGSRRQWCLGDTARAASASACAAYAGVPSPDIDIGHAAGGGGSHPCSQPSYWYATVLPRA